MQQRSLVWQPQKGEPFSVICDFAEGVYSPITQALSEKVTEHWQCWPLGYLSVSGLHLHLPADHNPLILETQLVFQPPHCAATYPVPHQLA